MVGSEAFETFSILFHLRSSHICSNSVVSKALFWMEVEDPKKFSSFECNHLVILMLQADVLATLTPAEFLVQMMHGTVKLVKILVAKQVIVDKIVLSSSIVETAAVSLTREVLHHHG